MTHQIRAKNNVVDHEGFQDVDNANHFVLKYRYIPLDSEHQGPIITADDPFYKHTFQWYNYYENAMNYMFGYKQGPAYKSAQYDHSKYENMSAKYRIQLFETPDQTTVRIANKGYDEYEPDALKMARKSLTKNKVRAERNNDRGNRSNERDDWRGDLDAENAGKNDADIDDRDLDDHNEGYRKGGIRIGGTWHTFR